MVQILSGRDVTEALQIGKTTTTGICELFNDATSTVNIASNSSRTGTMNIGTGTGSGTINIGSGSGSGPINIGSSGGSNAIAIDAGSSTLTLSGSNYAEGTWTPGVSDVSGNAGTVANSECNYSRLGNMVTCSVFMQITSKGSMVAGDVFRITGLPFTAGSSVINGTMHGPFLNGAPTGMYRVVCNSTSTIAKIRVNDSVAPLNRDVLVSDTVTGYIFGSFTYWVA